METKRDIETKARSLIDSAPEEAVHIYERIWAEFNDQFNAWDAFYYLRAVRKNVSIKSTILNEVVEKFKEDERVSGLYSWYIFDRYVKKAEKNALISNENIIRSSLLIGKQKDLSENHEFPCPYTIAVFNLADAHSENLFNASKINELMDFLNPEFLSTEVRTLHTEIKGDVEMASDKEKYYSLKTKALLKLEKFSECIELCDLASNSFKEFHYNNDTWFKMRKAICYEKLGETELGEKLFHEILNTKAGSDKWFLYSDIAGHYFEQAEYEKSWRYAVNAAYFGNEPQFMLNLYLLQTRILYKLNRIDEGKLLANLLAAIIKENDWKTKPEFAKLFKYYNVDENNLSSVKDYFGKAKMFWVTERYSGNKREKGQVIFVHESGKKGKIKTSSNSTYLFTKRDFRKGVKDLKQVLRTDVEFYPMKDFKGDSIAEDIVVMSSPKAETSDNIRRDNSSHGKVKIISLHKTEKIDTSIIGRTYKGKISSLKDFGILVSLPNKTHGLIHKNSKSLPENFQEMFSIGENIEVEVIEVTSRGISLRQIK